MTNEELLQKKVAMISLGCDKNTVDAERMLYLISNAGFTTTQSLNEASIVIINTCAFILDARKESIDKIFEIVNLKQQNVEKIIVTGCLPQKSYDEVCASIPEVDAFVRLKNNNKIVDIIYDLYDVKRNEKVNKNKAFRVQSTPKHTAFLKIADGCNKFCSYCTIPFFRGRYTSIPMEELVLEAKQLISNGVKELILVAQDVSSYGIDLYKEYKLVELLQKLSKIKDLKWIRLHYCYPNLITDELLNEIVNNDKICKYIDIPLQHISTNVLKNMNRKDTKESIEELISKIRNLPKYVAIRSTFMVGFPKETRKDFKELLDFLTKYKLDNVGFFKFSKEEGTRAYYMKGQVFDFIKKRRLKKVEQLQYEILLENQTKLVGKTLKCLCEGLIENKENRNIYRLRSEYSSLDVDTYVYIETDKVLKSGEFYNVKIITTQNQDLIGEIDYEHTK